MGATPAKTFGPPLPYGVSPDVGVLQQAKAAAPAPLNNFLPLNPQDPSQQAQQPNQGTQSPAQGQLGGLPNLNRYFQYGGGIRRNIDQ